MTRRALMLAGGGVKVRVPGRCAAGVARRGGAAVRARRRRERRRVQPRDVRAGHEWHGDRRQLAATRSGGRRRSELASSPQLICAARCSSSTAIAQTRLSETGGSTGDKIRAAAARRRSTSTTSEAANWRWSSRRRWTRTACSRRCRCRCGSRRSGSAATPTSTRSSPPTCNLEEAIAAAPTSCG